MIVPIKAKLHAKEAARIAAHSGARMVFVMQGTGGDWPAELRSVDVESDDYATLFALDGCPIEPRDATDLAWLFYTSGTTGRPKGVMLSHRNLMAIGLSYFSDVDAIEAADATVYAAPMSHGAGLYAVPHVMAGARHLIPASGGFDAAELFALSLSVGQLSLFAAAHPQYRQRVASVGVAHTVVELRIADARWKRRSHRSERRGAGTR